MNANPLIYVLLVAVCCGEHLGSHALRNDEMNPQNVTMPRDQKITIKGYRGPMREGDHMLLGCEPTSSYLLYQHYKWMYSTDDSKYHLLQHAQTLSVKKMRAEDRGYYACHASNGARTEVVKVHVQVIKPGSSDKLLADEGSEVTESEVPSTHLPVFSIIVWVMVGVGMVISTLVFAFKMHGLNRSKQPLASRPLINVHLAETAL